jgi:uncharacterized protein
MTTPLHDHLVNVADLVDRPGASRRVELRLPVPEGFEFPLVTVDAPLELDAIIESVVDGLLVRGLLHAELELSCARCLHEVSHDVDADVVELFVDPARASAEALEGLEEGYAVAEDHIDLDALLRDGLAPNAPYRPLCAESCQGLCARCGADLNAGACGCAEEGTDPRWAALAQLRDQLPTEN